MKLTRRQKEILDFITDFIDGNGYSPSMGEIASHFEFASLNAVYKHLEALSSRGYLHRDANRARSIELTAEASAGVRHLPLMGYIAAGYPIEAIEQATSIPVSEYFLPRRGECYVLEVKGDSMVEDHILNGDLIVVTAQDTAQRGETVVALIDNENVTLKKYFPEAGHIRLEPANAAFSALILEAERVKIQGALVSVLRKYQ